MATRSHQDEKERLARVYAGMSEGELHQIAEEAASLTDEAQAALQQELARRGLNLAPDHLSPQTPEVHAPSDSPPLVTVRRFRDLPEALLAKGSLDSAGIESALIDDNMIRLDWFISNLLGGIKLQVKQEDAEEALRVLDQPIPTAFEVEGIGEFHQPRCPKCQSLEVSIEGLNKPVAYTSTVVFGIPIPLPSNLARCHACGYQWERPEPADPPA